LSVGRIKQIGVPLLPLTAQKAIVAETQDLQTKIDTLKCLQAETASELDTMLPSILDKAFKGEL
jgi:type I restriction enzyme S subunit